MVKVHSSISAVDQWQVEQSNLVHKYVTTFKVKSAVT